MHFLKQEIAYFLSSLFGKDIAMQFEVDKCAITVLKGGQPEGGNNNIKWRI